MAFKQQLLAGMRVHAGIADHVWLEGMIEVVRFGELSQLLAAYTSVSRRIPDVPFLRPASRLPSSAMMGEHLESWTLRDAARAGLLLSRSEGRAAAGTFVHDALACYERGDTGEQQSWLRAVGVLPQPERFLATVVDACRTNIVPLFQAIACENPYPARCFPDANFNQLVLKAMFNDVALSRIVGLSSRANAELTRMALDYASERRAAGRSVPSDILLATTAGGVMQEQSR